MGHRVVAVDQGYLDGEIRGDVVVQPVDHVSGAEVGRLGPQFCSFPELLEVRRGVGPWIESMNWVAVWPSMTFLKYVG